MLNYDYILRVVSNCACAPTHRQPTTHSCLVAMPPTFFATHTHAICSASNLSISLNAEYAIKQKITIHIKHTYIHIWLITWEFSKANTQQNATKHWVKIKLRKLESFTLKICGTFVYAYVCLYVCLFLYMFICCSYEIKY